MAAQQGPHLPLLPKSLPGLDWPHDEEQGERLVWFLQTHTLTSMRRKVNVVPGIHGEAKSAKAKTSFLKLARTAPHLPSEELRPISRWMSHFFSNFF